jgi:PhnB protein
LVEPSCHGIRAVGQFNPRKIMSSPTTIEELNPAQKTTSPAASSVIQVQPYLLFGGRCEEALEYYRRVVGAEVTMLMRFKDSPEPGNCGPIDGEKVMHASFQIGGTTLLASDGCNAVSKFEGFSLSLSLPNPTEAGRIFSALAEGGQVQQPLIETFFAKAFGIVTDRFGMSWMIVVMAQP